MKPINQLLRQTNVNRSKKTVLLLALLVTVMTSFSFANGIDSFKSDDSKSIVSSADGIKSRVKASFRQDFKNAQFISSEVKTSFTKLTFRVKGVVLSAYYTENGKLIAIVRNILSSQLPINLMMDLKKSYSDFWITELFELDSEGQNSYYVSLENADTKLVLRSTDNNTWEVYQQTDKN
jgi:hypothetical protein